ncbi:MAG TPA: YhcH/YjgK/YiaL family protein [Bacteroidia bacterium]|jgi:YhcH/YjgK/YiaL family protein|nr:YhcH/YjgK/YiaL family protein [Bacteroidia bacterium]
MIYDKVENASRYAPVSARIAKGLEYIRHTDFTGMEPGKHEIEGEDLFAVINEYETKDESECVLEAHRKYLDIQYMLSGSEQIGISTLYKQEPVKAYNDKDDYALYSDKLSFFQLKSGTFAIFFPEDLHMPGVKDQHPSKIRKVIVKVRI